MCRGRIWIWGRLLGLIDVIALIVWTRTRTSVELYESENVFLGRLLGWDCTYDLPFPAWTCKLV